MVIRLLTSAEELIRWDAWVSAHPQASLWQSLAWKRLQEALGRKTRVYAEMDGDTITVSALVVIDRTAFGLSTWEIPRGPLWGMNNEQLIIDNDPLLRKVVMDAQEEKCMALYLSPASNLRDPLSIIHYQLSISPRHVHPEATRFLDLTLSDDELLAQMKQKGRYNIKVAQKHGVTVRESTDAAAFAALASETGKRDGFTPHSAAYYEKFLNSLEGSFLLLAYDPPSPALRPGSGQAHRRGAGGEGRMPIAGLIGVTWNGTGIYYYGASSHEARALMAPYLLQWEAMRLCRARGCSGYDLFGIAPEGASDHPWNGVTAFKEKFGGQYIEYPPEREMVMRPVVRRFLDLKRRFLP